MMKIRGRNYKGSKNRGALTRRRDNRGELK
jgi:hypothetical protein